jgi:BASS family bile acid:Na+ symporter
MLRTLVLAFVITNMLAMGMKLSVGQIVRPLRDFKFVARVLLVNIVLAPTVALFVTRLPGVQPSLAIALVLLATAAGSPVLPKLVEMAHGDLASAVSATLLLMVVTLVSMPLILPRAVAGVEVDARTIALSLVVYTLLPLMAGLALRAVREKAAEKLGMVFNWISTICLVVAMILAPIVHWAVMKELLFSGAGVTGLAFIALLTAMGWLLGGPDRAVRKVLTLCGGQRNIAAALVVASQNFADPRVFGTVILIMIASWIVIVPVARVFGRMPQ